MRADQERVKNLLTDTVTLLCKNGLQFTKQLKVQGLLGITTDDNDVFVVHINETFGGVLVSASESDAKNSMQSKPENSSQTQTPTQRKRPSKEDPEQSGAIASKVTRISQDDRLYLPKTSETDSSYDHDVKVKIENDDEDDVVFTGTTELDYGDQKPGFLQGNGSPRKRTALYDTGAKRHSSQTQGFERTVVEEQFAVEPSDSEWELQQSFGDGHQRLLPVNMVDVNLVLEEIPPEFLQPLPLSLDSLYSTLAEAQNIQAFGQNRAAFLVNKLLNMSFTKEEFARSRGVGKYLQVDTQQKLDPDKVQAVKDLLAFLCGQLGWEPLSSSLINHKFSQKCVHARHSAKSRKGGARQ